MTTTERPTVPQVLRALDRYCLLSLLPSEEQRLLAGPVARVVAGIELDVEEQRAAARLLQAAAPVLTGPLAAVGLVIPPPPTPVAPAVASRDPRPNTVPEAKLIDGRQRIGVRNVYALLGVVRALPGVRRGVRGGHWPYTLPASPAAARGLLDALAPYGYRVSRGVDELARAYDGGQDARALLVDGAPLPQMDPQTFGITGTLWTHQERLVAWGEQAPAILFAATMGAGKTLATVALCNRMQAARVLIVCPNRVRPVWPREVRKWARQGWHIADGTRAAKRRGAARQSLSHPERLAEAQALWWDCHCGAPVHAYVINYEAMVQRVWQEWEPPDKLDLIVYDEGHKLKGYRLKARPTKAPMGAAERAARDRGASAEEIRAAKRADAKGPHERALPTGYSGLMLKRAKLQDRLAKRAEEDARATRLTVSGVAARWVGWSHRRVALSGTPMSQHPWDIFGLYRALDPGVFGLVWSNRDETGFADKFVQMDKRGTFPVKIKPERLQEFADLTMSLMYRPVVDLDLPPHHDVVREVELEPDARAAYDELDQQLWTDLAAWLGRGGSLAALVDLAADVDGGEFDVSGSHELTARNILSRILRLQQLTGGTLRADPVRLADGRLVDGPVARVSTAKADELAEFDGDTLVGGVLGEIGCVPDAPGGPEPVIVFCRFRPDLDAVQQIAVKLGLRYGEVSGRRADGLNADAEMAPDKDLVAVQIQAGGLGIDLTRARYGVFYSLGYSVSDADQARARLVRPGQTRPVLFIHLVATETMDAAVYQAIKARKDAVAAVLVAGGVDPAEFGLHVPDPGPDPLGGAGRVDGRGAAVRLPWE